jgi:tetratricopeptide (TPR) repeat protein/DNA-binding CsgD family transcriptional regulator
MLRFISGIILLIASLSVKAQVQPHVIDSLVMAIKNAKHDTVRVNLLLTLAFRHWSSSPEKMIYYLDSAEAILETIEYSKGKGRLANTRGVYYWTQGEHTKALENYLVAYALYAKLGYIKNMAIAKINIGQIYMELGNNPKALLHMMEALKLLKNVPNSNGDISEVYNVIGNIYKNQSEFDNAINYYNESLQYAIQAKDSLIIGSLYINFGEIYLAQKNIDKAIEYQLMALSIHDKIHSVRGKAQVYHRLGQAYHLKKDYDQAFLYFQKSIQWAEDIGANNLILKIHFDIGQAFLAIHDTKKAIYHFNESLNLVKQFGNSIDRAEALEGLALAHKKNNHFKGAYELLEQANLLRDSIDIEASRKRIAQLQFDYEMENKNDEIELLKKDQQIKILQQNVSLGGFIALIIIGALTISRQRKSKTLMKKEKALIEAELKNNQLRKEQLEVRLKEMELRTKELQTLSINFAEKNELIEDLKSAIGEIKNTLPEENRVKLIKIVNSLQIFQKMDREKADFQHYFDQVHQDFFDNLRTNFPELSSKDLKMCALMRLNLDNKQIATILGITTESAKVTRHRVKKKLGVQTDINLNEFLRRLESAELAG